MMFEQESASAVSVAAGFELAELCGYLERSQRCRPVAVVDATGSSSDFIDVRALCDAGFDVAMLAPGLSRRFTERLGADSYRLQRDSVRVFATEGSVADGDVRSAFVYFDRNQPQRFQELVIRQGQWNQRVAEAERRRREREREREREAARMQATMRAAGDASGATEAGAAPAPAAGSAAVPAASAATPAATTVGAAPAPVEGAAPAPSFSAALPNAIDSPDAVAQLAQLIASPARALPVVVVTRRYRAASAFFDSAALAARVEGCAYVAEVADPNLNWALSSYLDADEAVYNGAARLYPAPERNGRYRPSSERFLYRPADFAVPGHALDRIESDVLGMSVDARQQEQAGRACAEVDAEVLGVLENAGRAVASCQVDGHRQTCTLHADEVLAQLGLLGLPASRVFARGMHVHGTLDLKTRMLSGLLQENACEACDALSAYRPGETALARVERVDPDHCDVMLFPGEVVCVDAEDVCDRSVRPSDLLVQGQVVPVYIAERGDEPRAGAGGAAGAEVGGATGAGADGGAEAGGASGGAAGKTAAAFDWLLSLPDADTSHIQPAPALLAGGPPWLTPDDVSRTAAPPVELPLEDEELLALDLPDDLDFRLRGAIQGVVRELGRSRARNAKLTERLQEEEHRTRRLARRIEEESAASDSALNRRYRRTAIEFGSEEERLAYEQQALDFRIREMWLTRTKPPERRERALPDSWDYGAQFVETLAGVNVRLDKVLRCMVDILLGMYDQHATHALRSGDGGDDAQRTDVHGNGIWRCYVERGRPQATRLHYSMGPRGRITFLSVRKHDDYRS